MLFWREVFDFNHSGYSWGRGRDLGLGLVSGFSLVTNGLSGGAGNDAASPTAPSASGWPWLVILEAVEVSRV